MSDEGTTPGLTGAAGLGVLALAATLAGGSLLLSAAPAYDPWAWLVWGREIAGWELDTSGGPSWKPLPSLLAAPLSLLGDAAPYAWLFITRFAWILAALLAALLAARLTPRADLGAVPGGAVAVGSVAAAGVVLLEDGFTPWLRQGAAGLSEPLLAALLLAAALARVAGRGRICLLLVLGCALLRPEAWAVLALLVVEGWRRRGEAGVPRRGTLLLAAAAVPLLWFVPDLLGSGDPLTGAGRAREAGEPAVLGAREALRGFLVLPLAALWAGAAVALAGFWERRIVRELGLVAGLWAVQVTILAVLGYAGLPRFVTPAAAIVVVLGAAGLAHAVLRARERGRAAALVVALALVVLAGQGGWRAGEIVGDARDVAEREERQEDFVAAADTVPVRAYMATAKACRWIHLSDFLHGPAVAWRLGLRLRDARPLPAASPPAGGIVLFDRAERPPSVVLEGAEPAASPGTAKAVLLPCRPRGVRVP